MDYRILYPPLRATFFNNILDSKNEIILMAPYFKYDTAVKIVNILETTKIKNKIKIELITSINIDNFVTGSSDVEAINLLLHKIPNTTIRGISNVHAKCYIFDSKVAIITSSNLTPNGLSNNLELGIELINSAVVGELRDTLLDTYGDQGKHINQAALKKINDQVNKRIEFDMIKTAELTKQAVEKFASTETEHFAERAIFSNNDVIAPQISTIISRYNPVQLSSHEKKLQGNKRLGFKETNNLLMAENKIQSKKTSQITARLGKNPDKKYFYDSAAPLPMVDGKKLSIQDLPQSKIDALKRLGFNVGGNGDSWHQHFDALNAYRREYPNQWPNTKEVYHGLKLGQWVLRQVKDKKAKRLSPYQIDQLNKINFVWDGLNLFFGQSFALLKEFRIKNPDKYPAVGETFRGYDLHSYYGSLRSNERNKLTDNQKKLLLEIGYPMSLWETMFQLLKQYIHQYGGMPSTEIVFHGQKLGAWLEHQRKIMGSGGVKMPFMPIERQRAMKSLNIKPLYPDNKSHKSSNTQKRK